MKKFIPYEKLSKKEKRMIDLAGRRTWNGLNPVTRKPRNPKAYNRKKSRRMNDDPFPGVFVIHPFTAPRRTLRRRF